MILMMRPLLTGIALSTLVLASGLLQASTNADNSASASTLTQKLRKARAQAVPNLIPVAANPAVLEQSVYNQVNQHRATLGLPPLTLDARISEQARIHSQNMASGKVSFSHQGFNQRVQAIAQTIPYNAAAENIAYNQGYGNPDTQAVQGWLKSPGHRTNIQGQYNLTGIGIARNAKGEYYFTQIFIQRR